MREIGKIIPASGFWDISNKTSLWTKRAASGQKKMQDEKAERVELYLGQVSTRTNGKKSSVQIDTGKLRLKTELLTPLPIASL